MIADLAHMDSLERGIADYDNPFGMTEETRESLIDNARHLKREKELLAMFEFACLCGQRFYAENI